MPIGRSVLPFLKISNTTNIVFKKKKSRNFLFFFVKIVSCSKVPNWSDIEHVLIGFITFVLYVFYQFLYFIY